ncbi:MAG: hypothetical protein A7316_09820, partial [Candidatus Altiarchaeales archaeon WOR_SM1_86-2]
MTAEIAIMNKEAIALASDSAVTMTVESGQKIFTSANKLFSLSKYYPVGIMVYGNAMLMGVPWETIIKVYRNNIGKKKFDTLKEYSTDFIKFLDNGNSLFPDSLQEEYLQNSINSYFGFIRKEIVTSIKSNINEKGGITDKEIKQIVSGIIKTEYEKWEKIDNIPSVPKSYNKNIIDKYEKIINKPIEKVIKEFFEELPISKTHSNQLKKIAASLFSKFPEHIKSGSISGVVIAGFGEDDTFPSLESFLMEGVCNNKLKYKADRPAKIDFKTSASITPFAEDKMVHTFMEGIDPKLMMLMEGWLYDIFDKYPEIIVENIENSVNEKKILRKKLKGASNKIFKDYQEEVRAYRKEKYVDPVVRVVSML